MTTMIPKQKAATLALAITALPVWTPVVANFTPADDHVIGKAIMLSEGTDNNVATGHKAIALKRKQGISAEVINIHTIKPLEEATEILNKMHRYC
jgi:transketolase